MFIKDSYASRNIVIWDKEIIEVKMTASIKSVPPFHSRYHFPQSTPPTLSSLKIIWWIKVPRTEERTEAKLLSNGEEKLTTNRRQNISTAGCGRPAGAYGACFEFLRSYGCFGRASQALTYSEVIKLVFSPTLWVSRGLKLITPIITSLPGTRGIQKKGGWRVQNLISLADGENITPSD